MVNVGRAFKQLGLATGGRVTCLDRIGATYEELGTDWENQVTSWVVQGAGNPVEPVWCMGEPCGY